MHAKSIPTTTNVCAAMEKVVYGLHNIGATRAQAKIEPPDLSMAMGEEPMIKESPNHNLILVKDFSPPQFLP